jgi:hypothetical protein
MAKKRKRAFRTEAERAAHEARVDEHLRIVDDLIDEHFAKIGRPRPSSSLEYLEEVMARYEPRQNG